MITKTVRIASLLGATLLFAGLLILIVASVQARVSAAPQAATAAIRLVDSANDSGVGTLRQALLDAQVGDTIVFSPTVFPSGNPATITLTSGPLPAINQNLVIVDASTAGVILDGSGTPAGSSGLVINGASQVTIKGLQIVGFPDSGIKVQNGATGCVIGGNNGTPGSACSGDCNLLGSSGSYGVRIAGTGTTGNTVSGNHIGTDAAGTAKMANGKDSGGYGVLIEDDASLNVIGGDTAAERNVISGNGDLFCGPPPQAFASGGGVLMRSGAHDNEVRGNYIGTDSSGSSALPNGQDGITVEDGVSGATIVDNLISGNSCDGPPPPRAGVFLAGDGNRVEGNRIGTNAAGTAALPNGWTGVWLAFSNNNTVHDNLISGNGTGGIFVGGSGHAVTGNRIGTDAAGTSALPNGGYGISFQDRADNNTIGGTRTGPGCGGDCNLISGNLGHGIDLYSWQAAGPKANTISGNWIGLDATGSAALPNGGSGISISGGAQDNLIGGDILDKGNAIAHNTDHGLLVSGQATLSNTVSHNSIYGNGSKGIELDQGGNLELFAPLLTGVTQDSVGGLAVPGSTVEIFSDDGDQGHTFEGSTTADGSGAFDFSKPGGWDLAGVTATATDAESNTSEFSAAAKPGRDVAVVAIYAPPLRQELDGSLTPLVRVGNGGTVSETFGVTVAITRAGQRVYEDEQTVAGLDPLHYRTVPFASWTPDELGAHDFEAAVQMTTADDDAGNDQQGLAFSVVDSRVDLWSRDNPGDRGQEPSIGPVWQSPDLWVRNQADGLPEPQDPINNMTNTVYVRVSNRGNLEATGATVTIYWHPPALVVDQSWWQPIGTAEVGSVAPGEATTVSLPWRPQVTGVPTVPYHTCLLDVISSTEDLAPAFWDVAGSNNIEQRNVDIVSPTAELALQAVSVPVVSTTFGLGNPYAREELVEVLIDAADVPDDCEVRLDLGDLFDRWLQVGQDSLQGAEVVSGTTRIALAGRGQATVGGLPLGAEELIEVSLEVIGLGGRQALIDVSERVGGVEMGGASLQVKGIASYEIYLPLLVRNWP